LGDFLGKIQGRLKEVQGYLEKVRGPPKKGIRLKEHDSSEKIEPKKVLGYLEKVQGYLEKV